MSSLREVNKITPAIVPGQETRCEARETPSLLKLNCKNFQQNQMVDTQVLDPIVCNDNYCRFSLDGGANGGILHSNSKIQLALKKDDPTLTTRDGAEFFSLSAGCAQLVQKAILRSGTTVLQEVTDFSHFYSAKGNLDSNENVKNRDSYTDGRLNAFQLSRIPTNGAVYGRGATSGEPPLTKLYQDTGLEFSSDYALATAKVSSSTLNLKPHHYLSNDSEYLLNISDLFSVLREFSMPLFLCSEPIIIELFFQSNYRQRLCCNTSSITTFPVKGTDAFYEIDTDRVKLIADFISYDESIMNDFASKNQTMAISFIDYQLVKAQTVAMAATNTTNLGGTGKLIDSILVAHSPIEDNTTFGTSDYASLQGNMISEDPSGATENVRIQVKLNDRNLFPIEIGNNAELYNNTTQAEGLPMNVTMADITNSAMGYPYDSQANLESYGLNVAGTWTNTKAYYGIKNIRANERVGNNGISLIVNKGTGTTSHIQRAYLGIRKMLVLSAGRFSAVFS